MQRARRALQRTRRALVGSSGTVELSLDPVRKRYPRDQHLGTEVQGLRIHHPRLVGGVQYQFKRNKTAASCPDNTLTEYLLCDLEISLQQPSNNVQRFQGVAGDTTERPHLLVKKEESSWRSNFNLLKIVGMSTAAVRHSH